MNAVKPAAPESVSWALSGPMNVRSVAPCVAVVADPDVCYAQSMIIPIVLSLHQLRLNLCGGLLAGPSASGCRGRALAISSARRGALIYGLRAQANAIVEHRRRARGACAGCSSTIGRRNERQQQREAATELERAASASGPTTAPDGVQRVQVEASPINVSNYVMWGSIGIAAVIGQIVLVLFLVYFLLASGDLYRKKLVKIVDRSHKKITLQILEEIDRQIEKFLLVQVFTSVVVAVVTWLAFMYLGVEQAAVWGILAGLFNSIPYFGPVLVSSGTAVVAFLQFGNLRMAFIVGGVALVITSLEGFLLTPWLTSRTSRMNAVAIFVGLLFWGWVWNIWGMLLAVPMLMVMKAICDHVEELNGLGELLGE
jgi:hypothetical protein